MITLALRCRPIGTHVPSLLVKGTGGHRQRLMPPCATVPTKARKSKNLRDKTRKSMMNEYDKVGQGSNIEHIRNYTKWLFCIIQGSDIKRERRNKPVCT